MNVLVHALRPDAAQHTRCRAWLEDAVNDFRPLALTSPVLSGVVRVLTHPKVFNPPSDRDRVVTELDRLLARPRVVRLEPGPTHWQLFVELSKDAGATGNLVPDAWLAAIAVEHGCTLVTLDGDFARFARLKRATPGPAPP